MSAPTEFDKRLVELNLTYAQIELVKQAVEELVIGSDSEQEVLPGEDGFAAMQRAVGGNQVRDFQRRHLRA